MIQSVSPPDGHVHSEWSWDAPDGAMERTCARAVEIGLPSLAFTEHADFSPWFIPDGRVRPGTRAVLSEGTILTPPPLDVDGYLAGLHRCRELFPSLRILSGVELSEPHWHGHETAGLLKPGTFDRVLASVHSYAVTPDSHLEFSSAYAHSGLAPADLVRGYLTEVIRMIEGSDQFEVLAHIDYPVRRWPADVAGPFDAADFEEEFRQALHILAASGRALEFNTRIPLDPRILRWWHDCGGDALSFGSDAHLPEALARGFADATDLATAVGFRPGRDPHDLWVRA